MVIQELFKEAMTNYYSWTINQKGKKYIMLIMSVEKVWEICSTP